MIDKTEAFIMKRFIYRDTSLILILFGRKWGKFKAIMKGVRDIKTYGRYDGLMEVFSQYNIVFYKRNKDFDFIKECELKKYNGEIYKDLKCFSFACYCMDLADYIFQTYEQNLEFYKLLDFFLSNLKFSPELYFYIFILKLLKYSGFMPHIDSCIICLKEIKEKGSFSSERGGFICKKCERRDKSLKYPISVGTIRSIWYIENNALSNLNRLKLNSKIIEELNFILFNFLDYHISYKPNSLRFVNAFL